MLLTRALIKFLKGMLEENKGINSVTVLTVFVLTRAGTDYGYIGPRADINHGPSWDHHYYYSLVYYCIQKYPHMPKISPGGLPVSSINSEHTNIYI